MSIDKTRLDKLSFGCPNLDAAFGGGVRVQGITEASHSHGPHGQHGPPTVVRTSGMHACRSGAASLEIDGTGSSGKNIGGDMRGYSDAGT